MKLLVTFGSKMGGTAGLAGMVGESLAARGVEADVRPAREVRSLEGYDAVIVGGALYMFRWHRDARRFVKRNARALADRPTWFFSSGPLDDSATASEIPPTKQVAKLMERVGARGHMTFGGRMPADAKGFPASSMAKTNAGDWRDPDHVDRWVEGLLVELDPHYAESHLVG